TLAGAGIDVWYNYSPDLIDGKKYPYTLPFHTLDSVILSPHRGGSPLARPDRYTDVIENIKRFIRSEPLLNLINLDRGY
ncbi:hydroxyacid dehydrogenase, partial [bacterium]|nr:hydroxyacid dehydrogenase [candidate division CSSED10-310 bacterium]